MIRWTVGMTGIVLLCHCTASFQATTPTGDEVTIFLPGYKGSFLARDEDPSERIWINPTDVLCAGERTLSLPFEDARAPSATGPLHPDGPVTKLTILPLVGSVDAYQSWLEYGARTLPGFVPFAYDWRQDIRVSAARLAAFIDQQATSRQGRLHIRLIGHSMGGLVAMYYLRYGADTSGTVPTWSGARRVDRVVFVGTPFLGSTGIFDDFFLGTKVGRNRALLSREALLTFPSAFQLLPGTDDFFIDEQSQPVAVEASLPGIWIQNGWGVFSNSQYRGDPAAAQQLTRMLEARATFFRAMHESSSPPPASLKALVVVGRGRPTDDGVRFVGGRFDFDHPAQSDGDDSVAASRALPRAPLDFQLVETAEKHANLLKDDQVRLAITEFLSR